VSHAHHLPKTRRRIGWAAVFGLVCALLLLPGAADAKGKKKSHPLTVMTRNLYLGADLSPILNASNVNQAVDAGGEIVNQVHATKFPSVRAALLANEIKKKKPDVIGLQEAALWRTGPVNIAAALGTPSAAQLDPLGGDFLNDLLTQLNTGKTKVKQGAKKKSSKLRYRVAVVKTEFDAEFPVNDNGQGSGLAGADHNERLTMRDAILVRKGVKTSSPSSGTYNTLLRVNLAGVKQLDVTRGWAAVNVKAHTRKLHIVDTHLESFDSKSSNGANNGQTYPKGGIREAQAKQLTSAQPNGAVSSGAPTILLGDLNSNFPATGDQQPGDTLAFQAVTAAGFQLRQASAPPFSCCIEDPNLAQTNTVGVSHVVDHVMTNSGKVRFKKGGVTSTYANGLWSSDHFGVFSRLLIK
jgi:endonuclease/exonuclease/phosphatase family metal-dependent hydrolase